MIIIVSTDLDTIAYLEQQPYYSRFATGKYADKLASFPARVMQIKMDDETLDRRRKRKATMLLIDCDGTKLSHFLLNIATPRRKQTSSEPTPFRAYNIQLHMPDTEDRDLKKHQHEASVFRVIRNPWWGFEKFQIVNALDRRLAEETEAAITGIRWTSRIEFLAMLNDCLRDGVKAYVSGDLLQAITAWNTGLNRCRCQIATNQYKSEWLVSDHGDQFQEKVVKYMFTTSLKLADGNLRIALQPDTETSVCVSRARNAQNWTTEAMNTVSPQDRFQPSIREGEKCFLFLVIANIISQDWAAAKIPIRCVEGNVRHTLNAMIISEHADRAELCELLGFQ